MSLTISDIFKITYDSVLDLVREEFLNPYAERSKRVCAIESRNILEAVCKHSSSCDITIAENVISAVCRTYDAALTHARDQFETALYDLR